MDVTAEIERSLRVQLRAISRMAQEATDRIFEMYTVGSGVCGCGASMEDHPVWDDHSPVEMLRDKSYYADGTHS